MLASNPSDSDPQVVGLKAGTTTPGLSSFFEVQKFTQFHNSLKKWIKPCSFFVSENPSLFRVCSSMRCFFFFSSLCFLKHSYLILCVCLCVCVHTHEFQRTACRNWFFAFVVWTLGMILAASTFTNEPFPWP